MSLKHYPGLFSGQVRLFGSIGQANEHVVLQHLLLCAQTYLLYLILGFYPSSGPLYWRLLFS
jgi:hypothetical protein